MPFESDDDYSLGGHVDIFYVAAVLLQVGAYLGEGVFYLLFYDRFLLLSHIFMVI